MCSAGVCCLSWDNQPTGSNWRLQTDLVQLEQTKSLHYSTTSSYNDNEDDNYLEVTNINALMHVIYSMKWNQFCPKQFYKQMYCRNKNEIQSYWHDFITFSWNIKIQ